MVTCHCLVYPVGKGREAMFPYTFCQWKLDEFWPSGANSSMTLNPWGGQLFSRRQLFCCSFHFADPVYSNQVLSWDHLYWTQEIWKIQPSMVQIPKLVGWFAVYRLCLILLILSLSIPDGNFQELKVILSCFSFFFTGIFLDVQTFSFMARA